MEHLFLAFFLFMAIAFLYSSVGHAGASGYLAIMSLLSFPIESIKPMSLVLNIVVSLIATYKFLKEGCFDRKVFVSLAVTSIPCAFIGGYVKVNPEWFKVGAGIFLILAAALLLLRKYIKASEEIKSLNLPLALVIGAIIGLISGLLGIGGGIFVSPIIITLGWATIRNTSGIAALFILCNSILGLLGHYLSIKTIDFNIVYWVIAVSIGGFIGAHYGAKRFRNEVILILLSIVLLSAGLKFILV